MFLSFWSPYRRNDRKKTKIAIDHLENKLFPTFNSEIYLDQKTEMNQLKAIFPFIASIGVFFFASNSPMLKQMNQLNSVENEIKSIPVEEFK